MKIGIGAALYVALAFGIYHLEDVVAVAQVMVGGA